MLWENTAEGRFFIAEILIDCYDIVMMETFLAITHVLYQMGITFGVGASTFALTFFINALEDGVID
ncbi:MAG: hypothetical protein AAB830_02320, partial [Patescibacteria group bacterium]